MLDESNQSKFFAEAITLLCVSGTENLVEFDGFYIEKLIKKKNIIECYYE